MKKSQLRCEARKSDDINVPGKCGRFAPFIEPQPGLGRRLCAEHYDELVKVKQEITK